MGFAFQTGTLPGGKLPGIEAHIRSVNRRWIGHIPVIGCIVNIL